MGDNKTVQCEYGHSASGMPCVQQATFLHGVHYSILPALTTEGIIALDIFEGSVTKEQFLAFIHEQVVCASFTKMKQVKSNQNLVPAIKSLSTEVKCGNS